MSKEIILIDKPKGITSFDVIRKLRKIYGIRKMGHAGTLDPLASGLMIVATGEGTKKLHEFLKLPKVYRADILLGERSATGDKEGTILERREVPVMSKEKVHSIAAAFKGKIHLHVPAYSAVKVGGVPLYKKARLSQEPMETPVKEMEVLRITLLEYKRGKETRLIIECEVTSGTYIRSLAEELGRRLGTVATVKDLRRVQVGAFRIEDAKTLEELEGCTRVAGQPSCNPAC